jgi:hypothetical protein
MAEPTVEVVGMAALRRDVRRLSADQQGPIYAAIKDAGRRAATPVAAKTRAAVPHDRGTLASSVRISSTRTGAAVRMGRAKVPYAGWIEFGGTRPDGSSRAFVPGGRYLFPAAQGLASVSAALYSEAIGRELTDPALWTNTTDNPGGVHD